MSLSYALYRGSPFRKKVLVWFSFETRKSCTDEGKPLSGLRGSHQRPWTHEGILSWLDSEGLGHSWLSGCSHRSRQVRVATLREEKWRQDHKTGSSSDCENHIVWNRNESQVTFVSAPELCRSGWQEVVNVVAVRQAMGTKFGAPSLDLCHLNLKVSCCPGVTGPCVVFLRQFFLLLLVILKKVTLGRCHGIQPMAFFASRIAHSSRQLMKVYFS